jgi:hypothetical protein
MGEVQITPPKLRLAFTRTIIRSSSSFTRAHGWYVFWTYPHG